MSHLPVEGHCLSAKDALSRGGLDAARVLAHREDVKYRLLMEFTHLLGPDAPVIDGEAIRKKFTRLLADYLTHARKLVHRSERAVFDSARSALAAEERPEPHVQSTDKAGARPVVVRTTASGGCWRICEPPAQPFLGRKGGIAMK